MLTFFKNEKRNTRRQKELDGVAVLLEAELLIDILGAEHPVVVLGAEHLIVVLGAEHRHAIVLELEHPVALQVERQPIRMVL